jgi:hypothetical protein
MLIQNNETDRPPQADSPEDRQNHASDGAYRPETMAKGARDPIVTDYVKRLMRNWLAGPAHPEKPTLKSLAKRAGIGGSAPSQIMSGKLGVGGTVIRGLSRALGVSMEDLYADAYAWDADGRPDDFIPPSEAQDLGTLVAKHPGRWHVAAIHRAGEREAEGFIPRIGWPKWLDEVSGVQVPTAKEAGAAARKRFQEGIRTLRLPPKSGSGDGYVSGSSEDGGRGGKPGVSRAGKRRPPRRA